uniref:Uncharacterized protein n=1 Tax=Neobodo designis TaxID=312471 RepID=A0A7S1QUH2_NEODS|mmetsp:Transcript_52374/g.161248  ORF Transcript_52374/g.161248 Transcript_52374/m.161248 type:complete len:203 (+) Transcript_52374:38-646(+)
MPIAIHYEDPTPVREAEGPSERELKLEIIELRSLCRELQARLDRAMQDEEATRVRMRESRARAAAREEELCAEVDRLRRAVELERRRAMIPGEWSELSRRHHQSSTQTSPARPSASERIDTLVESATSPVSATKMATERSASPHAGVTADTTGAHANFVDEVAALAFDGQVGSVLQDALQAVVLRELLRRESHATEDDTTGL